MSIKKNYIYNLVYQILSIIIPIITTPYISSCLGAEGVGIYSYSYSIVTYFVLIATLGSSWYGQREIAYCGSDKSKRSIAFWNIFILRVNLTLVSSIFYLIYAIKYSNHLLISLIQILYILAVGIDVTWYFQGMENFKVIVTRNIVIKIISVACIFIFVNDVDDLILYVLNLAFFPFIGNFLLWRNIKNEINKINLKKINIKSIFFESFKLFVPTLAIQVYTVLDKTMIGLFTNTSEENGYYEQAEKIVKVSTAILTSLGTVIAPRIAHAFEKRDYENIRKNIYKSFRFVWVIGIPITMGLITLADMLVPWFLGNDFIKCIVLIQIFSGLVLAIGLNGVSGVQYLVPTKKQKIFTFSIICGAICNVVLNLVLIPRYFSVGAAIASVAAESIVSIIQLFYIISYCEFSIKKIFLPSIKYFFAAVLMGVLLFFIKMEMKADMLNTFALIIIGMFVYFLILYIIKDKFLLEQVDFIKQKMKQGRSK